MRLFLSRLHFPVTTLGLGRRIGIWFQGCTIRCPGCVSADTWPHGQSETTIAEIMATLALWLPEADGITLSGGEPFEQLPALEALLASLRKELSPHQDILLYTGKTWKSIAPRVDAWPGWADIIISEPFVKNAPQTLVWRGSDNQLMHLITDLGKSLYTPWISTPRSALPKAMDVFLENDTLWMAGIPDPDSIDGIHRALSDAGFTSSTSQAPPRPPATHLFLP
jgi:anaerobic ribonucleoside-triphosphate reductase activating protein